jgi:hypothetical protein
MPSNGVHIETLSCQTHAEHIDFEKWEFSHQWCFCNTLGILSFFQTGTSLTKTILVDYLLFYVLLGIPLPMKDNKE